jgi:hypothetical protein
MMKDLDGTGFTVIVLVPGGVTQEAAGNAGAPVAWTSIATMPITRSRSYNYPPSKP